MAVTVNNVNIVQITDEDIKNLPSENKTIEFQKATRLSATGQWIFLKENKDVPYKVAVKDVKIFKLGYCCEPKGIDYPIFIKVNGNYEKIVLGKNCIYETQPEKWRDVNKREKEDKNAEVTIDAVMVPAGIDFTLDYAMSIN